MALAKASSVLVVLMAPMAAQAVSFDSQGRLHVQCPQNRLTVREYKFSKSCGPQHKFSLIAAGDCWVSSGESVSNAFYEIKGAWNGDTGKAVESVKFMSGGSTSEIAITAKCTGNPWISAGGCTITAYSGADVASSWGLNPTIFPLSKGGITSAKAAEMNTALANTKPSLSLKFTAPAAPLTTFFGGVDLPVRVEFSPPELRIQQSHWWRKVPAPGQTPDPWQKMEVLLDDERMANGVYTARFIAGNKGDWEMRFQGSCPSTPYHVVKDSRIVRIMPIQVTPPPPTPFPLPTRTPFPLPTRIPFPIPIPH